jgi:hypothetical protein
MGALSTLAFTYYLINQTIELGYKKEFHDGSLLVQYEEVISSEQRTYSERFTISHQIASAFYVETGKTIDVLDGKGGMTQYMPSPEDIKMRDEIQNLLTLLKSRSSDLIEIIIILILVVVLSTLIGIISGKYFPKVPST